MVKQEKVSFAQLLDWVEGRLPAEEAAAVAAQVAADTEVQKTVGWLEAFQQISADVVLGSSPEGVRAQLNRRFEAFAEGRRQPGLLQRLVAQLDFDSGRQLAAAGVRSAATQGQERQFVYSTDLADIALNLQPRFQDNCFDVMGQILPLQDFDPAFYNVRLLRDNTEVDLTITDSLGEFLFEAVAPGEYRMLLSDERVEVIISPLLLNA